MADLAAAIDAAEAALPIRAWRSRRETAIAMVAGMAKAGWAFVGPDVPEPTRVMRVGNATVVVWEDPPAEVAAP